MATSGTRKQTTQRKPTKKSQIVAAAARIVASYSNIRLTLRQLHYRLVEGSKSDPTLTYVNTKSAYKGLSAILVQARRDGSIRADVFEDKGRDVKNWSKVHYYPTYYCWTHETVDPVEVVREHVTRLVERARYYSIPNNAYQPDVVVVMLEKAALENFYIPICEELHVVLIVCRGYNSYTQLDEFATAIRGETRNIHVVAFSDFDPSGIDIERNFLKQIQDMGVNVTSHERIGLTEEQVIRLGLPYAPVKIEDSRAAGWSAGGVVELDAVDPVMLQAWVRDAITARFDQAIHCEVVRLQRVCRRRAVRRVGLLVQQIDATMNTNFVGEFGL